MADEGFDLVVGQLVRERLHFFLVVFLKSVLDRQEHFFVVQGGLVFGIGLVLDPGFLAGLRFALSIFAVAGSAMFGPILLDIRSAKRGGESNGNETGGKQD